MVEDLIEILFIPIFGTRRSEIKLIVSKSFIFRKLIPELSNKLGLEASRISILSTASYFLTSTDLERTVEEITEDYGKIFKLTYRSSFY